ncbi:MAG: YaeQ family protein [Steroidobacter sp.]
MALGATVYVFEIQLADADRNVYETLSLRVAQHPSETKEYLLTRVLAYCLEYTEGIAFSSGGLSDPDEPAIAVRDLTGALQTWIDVGAPDAARLHKAGKAAQRVAVYSHKQVNLLLERLEGERIHRADAIAIYAMDADLLADLGARLARRMHFDLSVSEGHLYITIAADTLSGAIEMHRLGG